MNRDDRVRRAAVTIEIKLTGDQVIALCRAAKEHYLEPAAKTLIYEIETTYNWHFHNDMIRPAWEEEESE
jgi:hypothetical protein